GILAITVFSLAYLAGCRRGVQPRNATNTRTRPPGSWRALFRFFKCIGNRKVSESPSTALRAPSPPLYVFTVGSIGDSPVPSGDPPDGTEGGTERNNGVFSHPGFTNTPPGGSPGVAGASPAPPSVNRWRVQGYGVLAMTRPIPSSREVAGREYSKMNGSGAFF